MREPDYSVRWMTANVSIPAEVKSLEREVTDALGRELRDEAKLEAPYQTGALVNSILYQDGRVKATAPHALYVHEGTKPHAIYPKRPGGVLSWVSGGVRRFARHVNHPGNRPNPFMRRAMERVRRERNQIAQAVLDRWLHRNRVR